MLKQTGYHAADAVIAYTHGMARELRHERYRDKVYKLSPNR